MTAEDARVRVLVAEDVVELRRAVVSWLSRIATIEVVGEAADGQAAVDAVDRLRPDVVLMDLRMPNLDGVEATRIIVRRHPDVAVVILSAYGEQSFIDEALRAGARSYLFKDSTPRAVADAILSVAKETAVAAAPDTTAHDVAADRPGERAGTAIIDRDTIGAILDLRHDSPEDIEVLVDLFISNNSERITRIRAAIARGDAAAVAHEAHALRGASATFGAARVVASCRELELRVRTEQLGGAEELVADLDHEFRCAVEELRAVWAA